MKKRITDLSIFSNKIDLEDINVKVAILYMLFIIALFLLILMYLAFIKK